MNGQGESSTGTRALLGFCFGVLRVGRGDESLLEVQSPLDSSPRPLRQSVVEDGVRKFHSAFVKRVTV